ncbi:hypothetical protein GWI33_005878 [Rhynchophorus ferrugineus]|uniref:Uncharacterized protein n=1 Tax=Rhynchophorus ferrugineus TaxID=354439 RepID=A0A834MHN9_RHYFE|nr:hypothetical protein GWI33_005878 [Rhynchophorus ferrugineus]
MNDRRNVRTRKGRKKEGGRRCNGNGKNRKILFRGVVKDPHLKAEAEDLFLNGFFHEINDILLYCKVETVPKRKKDVFDIIIKEKYTTFDYLEKTILSK